MHDDDHPLREQLRRVDPARDLAPLPPTWLDHRMEQMMTDSTDTAGAISAQPARRRRGWIVAAAAAALAAGAAIVVPLALGGAPTTEVLAHPSGGGITTGSCLPVTPEGLSSQEKAFAARVIAVEGGTVTLEVTERFAGEVADRVEVTQPDAIDSDFSSVSFELGESYLVAAGDGTVRGCGLSGTDSPELRAVYDAAFGD
ncbi:MAG: hypothetical protein WBL06_11360 [Pseudolysinimonas sp.]|uniref:hypothetical protein n=1 Tax=Pseudolysinimonas sp. TaxID=2680009 RepID=UPI003C76EA96